MQLSWTNILVIIQIVVFIVGCGVIYGILRTRLDYMEQKLDKHNNFIERVYELESNVKAIWRKMDDICEEFRERNRHE